jgi:putative DNA primase/helicase
MHSLTDDGNAKRFIDSYGSTVRYNRALGWLTWSGTHWVSDPEAALRLARDCARSIAAEAESCGDDKKFINKVQQWARQSLAAGRIEAILKLARSDKSVHVVPSDLNRSPYLLNTPSGTVDLKTGRLLTHDPKHLITQITNTPYDEHAVCPRWQQFLLEIQPPSIIQSLQLMAGYSLTGLLTERAMFIPFGGGANGKSVFLDTLLKILGDYATSIPAPVIMRQRYDNRMVMNYMAHLHGKRLVHASESDASQFLSEPAVKTVTGDQILTAEFKFKDPFLFTPTFKLWLATNHKPRVSGTDNAIWSRLRLIPFDTTIPEEAQDRFLIQHLLQSEAPGILRWAVVGCLAYLKALSDGHPPPMAMEIIEATDEYKTEQDIIGAFLDDNVIANEAYKVSSTSMYSRYKKWCETNGHRNLSHTKFSVELKARRFLHHRLRDGVFWMHVQLTSTSPYSSYDDEDEF